MTIIVYTFLILLFVCTACSWLFIGYGFLLLVAKAMDWMDAYLAKRKAPKADPMANFFDKDLPPQVPH